MSEWQKVKIGDLITQYKNIEDISATKEYKQVTVSSTGEIKLRNIEKGSNIKAKTGMIVKKGTFIYSRLSIHNGAFGIIPNQLDTAIVTNEMPVFRFNESKIIPEFFLYLLKAEYVQFQLQLLTKGVGRVRIKEKNFLNIDVLVPDIDTQHILTVQILEHAKKHKVLEQQNNFQKSYLTLLRQQILQDAISGKITSDWRSKNPNIEPASKLLEKIKAEKEKLIAEKKIKKEKPLPKIAEDEVSFELPEKWEWCRLGDVCFKITDGFHNTPPKAKEGFPYIAATHVKSEKIDWGNCHYVSEKFHRELWDKAFPQKGEVLVVNIGAGSGTPAIIDVEYEFSFKNTAILKFFQDKLNNEYLFNFFMSSRSSIYTELTKGGLQPFLSLKILKNIVFPLPPLAEQKAIVAKVEKLMEQVSKLEEKIKQNKQDAEMLMQTFLAEAFQQ